ncbi:methylated-DNA--[protein]-cysteine S-methyltransferase [Gallaecimonas kandeliae]|uniref:methylated-DNA--[protein]-cysteine S-methyltransferase n=1 Tax=Gallaecimonas kandeliae TaxID=3029055 RepID=UPI002648C5A7|nr:methylated-DNA--[protein]-cysteine S-methyltransferase [Gallaecimonas kandeliae]WKE65765.1 methylated-DNA--[protein]-cysteine S-methyltransferase [Gallaecimonas kandeliae]
MSFYQLLIPDTPIGALGLVADDQALQQLRFLGAAPAMAAGDSNPILELAAEEVGAYFAGTLRHFSVPLAPKGTAFQLAVWAQLSLIPYGETRSYGDIARALGQPGASRAVGLANNRNPLPLIVPCHRVIGADGSLVGFGGGLAIKQQLLALENPGPQLDLF